MYSIICTPCMAVVYSARTVVVKNFIQRCTRICKKILRDFVQVQLCFTLTFFTGFWVHSSYMPMSCMVEWVRKVKVQPCHVYEIKNIETPCLVAFQSTATINCIRKEFFNFTLGFHRHVSITLAYMPECFLGSHSTPFHAKIKITFAASMCCLAS